MSVSQFLKDNEAVSKFHSTFCLVKLEFCHVVKTVSSPQNKDSLSTLNCNVVNSSVGHPYVATLFTMLKILKVHVVSSSLELCKSFNIGKMHHKSFPYVSHSFKYL